MAKPKIIGADKAFSLTDLNKYVKQQEEQLGPLIEIGNNGDQTLLTIDMDPDPPVKFAVIVPVLGGVVTLPPGTAKICEGKVFITNLLVDAVAAR